MFYKIKTQDMWLFKGYATDTGMFNSGRYY